MHPPPPEPPTIFELLAAYHRGVENLRAWFDEAGLAPDERAAITDAFQAEASDWFRGHGFCFECSRELGRCRCADPGGRGAD